MAKEKKPEEDTQLHELMKQLQQAEAELARLQADFKTRKQGMSAEDKRWAEIEWRRLIAKKMGFAHAIDSRQHPEEKKIEPTKSLPVQHAPTPIQEESARQSKLISKSKQKDAHFDEKDLSREELSALKKSNLIHRNEIRKQWIGFNAHLKKAKALGKINSLPLPKGQWTREELERNERDFIRQSIFWVQHQKKVRKKEGKYFNPPARAKPKAKPH